MRSEGVCGASKGRGPVMTELGLSTSKLRSSPHRGSEWVSVNVHGEIASWLGATGLTYGHISLEHRIDDGMPR